MILNKKLKKVVYKLLNDNKFNSKNFKDIKDQTKTIILNGYYKNLNKKLINRISGKITKKING